jgi:hypothetical protein
MSDYFYGLTALIGIGTLEENYRDRHEMALLCLALELEENQ